MDNSGLDAILRARFGEALQRQGPGRWVAVMADGLKLSCMTDERADRMRFMIPVMPVGGAPKEFMERVLRANFHSALDARYAMEGGLIWSAFLHPLRCLTKDFAESAIDQVVKLATTTGTTYSSCDLFFVGSVAGARLDDDTQNTRQTAEAAFKAAVADSAPGEGNQEWTAPPHLCDPLTFELMTDPVQVPSGHTFERSTILEHIARFHNNPFTRQPLTASQLTPNRSLVTAIAAFRAGHTETA